jgi:hypothetical protein
MATTKNVRELSFTLLHDDHGIKDAQLIEIYEQLENKDNGFFIHRFELDNSVIPMGLYGPDAGDPPVTDAEVQMIQRSLDRPADRLIDKPYRPVDFGQAIGSRDGDNFTLFTVYGGPLAPQNPLDPNNPDPEGSSLWWSDHALCMGPATL